MTFAPSGLGETIFSERYEFGGEGWEGAGLRLATAQSKAEANGKQAIYQERFQHQLVEGFFMPGGRFWYGAGRKIQQQSNCFVVDVSDSIEGWGELMKEVAVISSRGGGVGINFSPIRPRGYPIGGMGGTATGAVSLMRIIDAVGSEIKDGGGRRAALMMCLAINHPDILEFLDAKLVVGSIENGNISVVLPAGMSPEEFVRLVREDGVIPLMFNGLPDKDGRTIRAREIWDRLVHNAWLNGEPGVLNLWYAEKMNNISYLRPVICTNPCGEQFLTDGGVCNLGHLVLPRFIGDGKLNWDMLDESVRLAVRFLDDAIDVTDFPLPRIAQVAHEERRVGLGYMGLHSMLLDLGLKYTDAAALEFADKLFGTIKNTAYDASINLAIEKGPFPLFRQEYVNSGFVKTLKRGLRNKIREHGIRNSHLLTVAPCGTTSMVQGVTGGIEPLFSPVYVRRRRTTDDKQIETIAETLVVSQEYVDHPELVEGAYDVTPRQHLEMQAVAQRHCDNAVSKTINLPKDMPEADLSDLWLEYLPVVKGTTFYREGSRETADSFEPMRHVPVTEMSDTVLTWLDDGRDVEYEAADTMDCATGACAV